MAGPVAPVEAFTISGYEDTIPTPHKVAMIAGAVGGLALVVGGFLLAIGRNQREKERLPQRPPTSWAFEGRRR